MKEKGTDSDTEKENVRESNRKSARNSGLITRPGLTLARPCKGPIQSVLFYDTVHGAINVITVMDSNIYQRCRRIYARSTQTPRIK